MVAGGLLPSLIALSRTAQDRGLRFLASRIITNIVEAGSPGVDRLEAVEMARTAFSVLRGLLGGSGGAEHVLATLVRKSEEMQRNACDPATLTKLVDMVRGCQGAPGVKEGSLKAIAAFCLTVKKQPTGIHGGIFGA